MIRLSGSTTGRDKIFYLLYIDQTWCETKQAPYLIGKMSSVLLAKSDPSVKLTTHYYLVQNLRTTKSTTPQPYIPSRRPRRQTSSLYIHTYLHTGTHNLPASTSFPKYHSPLSHLTSRCICQHLNLK